MIIDFHTHIFPDKIATNVIEKLSSVSKTPAFTDGTLNGLIKSMDHSQINLSIILPVATNIDQVEKINRSAVNLNEKFNGDKIFSFGCIQPDCEDYREVLSQVKSHGLKGIKIHPVYQNTNIDDTKFLRIFYQAAELNLIVVTHAGFDIGFPNVDRCNPRMIRRVIDGIGNFKFVLAHMGGWKYWEEVKNLLADTKIYLDTAFSSGRIIPRDDFDWTEDDLQLLNADQFMEFIKIFGADRILFGTDSPWTSQLTSIEFIKNLSLDDSDRNKILGQNAKQLLEI